MDHERGLLFLTHNRMGVPESRPATAAPVELVELIAVVHFNSLGMEDDSDDDDQSRPAEPVEHPLQPPNSRACAWASG